MKARQMRDRVIDQPTGASFHESSSSRTRWYPVDFALFTGRVRWKQLFTIRCSGLSRGGGARYFPFRFQRCCCLLPALPVSQNSLILSFGFFKLEQPSFHEKKPHTHTLTHTRTLALTLTHTENTPQNARRIPTRRSSPFLTGRF